MDKIIGCTQDNSVKGEPFCDVCQEQCGSCSFYGKSMKDIQQNIKSEQQLKATFVKLYLEKIIRMY